MLNTFQVNLYDNIKSPQVNSTISVNEWFAMIRTSEHTNLITAAREYPKGSPQYDGIKSIIPCVTYNFRFKNNKSNDNIESGSGLLYIDIDDPLFDPSQLDLSKVYAYYRSFGGVGYCIVVKVYDLTLNNYKSTYQSVLDQLGIACYHDKGAVKPTQFSVLSFDPDIYINELSFVFTAVEKDPNPFVIGEEKGTYTQGLGTSNNQNSHQGIRFHDLDRLNIKDEYQVFPEGIPITKCFIPKNVVMQRRNDHLIAYCNNLVYLNPLLSYEATFTIMANVNTYMCQTPVDSNQLRSLVKSVFDYKEKGTLCAKVSPKLRKIVFSKECNMTATEKLLIAGKEINKLRSHQSKQKIYDAIEDWDHGLGKITQMSVVKATGLNKKTVQKYWSEFKGYVGDLNREAAKAPSTKSLDTNTSEQDGFFNWSLEEKVLINSFMASLYQDAGVEIDFNSIVQFTMVLNTSEATIGTIIRTAIQIYKDRQYNGSLYKEVVIPNWMIEMFQKYKATRVAA